MGRVSVMVVPYQPTAAQAFLDYAVEQSNVSEQQQQCTVYCLARERPNLPSGTLYSAASSGHYQRWRELQYELHTEIREQSAEERDLRVALYDAWLTAARERWVKHTYRGLEQCRQEVTCVL